MHYPAPVFEIIPTGRLIHITRNARDVAASLAGSDKRGVGKIVDYDYWIRLRQAYVERVRVFGRSHPRFLECEYERFCHEPVEVVSEICDFLDMPLHEQTKQFLRTTIYTHRINIG